MKITESFAVEATEENKKDPRWNTYVEWLEGLDNKLSHAYNTSNRIFRFYGVRWDYYVSNDRRYKFSDILSLDGVFEKYNIPFSGKQMTEKQLLEKAKKDFPAVTVFESISSISSKTTYMISSKPMYMINSAGSIEVTVSGFGRFKGKLPSRVIYSKQKDQWAEIISMPKEPSPKVKKRIQDLGKDDVVHCPTEREAKEILRLAHEQGLEWRNGDSFLEETHWSSYKDQMCYSLKVGEYTIRSFYKEKGRNIFPASDFLPASFYDQIQEHADSEKLTQSIRNCDMPDEDHVSSAILALRQLTEIGILPPRNLSGNEPGINGPKEKNTELMKPLLLHSRKQKSEGLYLAPINKPTK